MKFSLSEISTRIHASVEGEQNLTIHGVASLEDAEAGELTFAESNGFVDKAARSQAGAIVVGTEFPQLPGKTLLRVNQPRLAFLNIMELFTPIATVRGIHPKAHFAERAVLGEAITVDAYAVIDEGAKLGKSTWVGAGSYIGVDVVLGEGCVIGPNVSLLRGVTLHDRVTVHAGTVIGGDGFGYQWLQDHHHKIPQLGTVVIEDDVEIGCNCCIDRATLGETRIGRGTKIDNLVQVAHNDHIGADVILVAQVGIAGSVTVGNGAVIGGQAAITDHVEIGPRARIGARSGVTKDVAAGETVLGAPARPIRQAKREFAGISRLPELRQRVQAQEESLRALAKRVQELERLDRD